MAEQVSLFEFGLVKSPGDWVCYSERYSQKKLEVLINTYNIRKEGDEDENSKKDTFVSNQRTRRIILAVFGHIQMGME